jgi:hypothetical protein
LTLGGILGNPYAVFSPCDYYKGKFN